MHLSQSVPDSSCPSAAARAGKGAARTMASTTADLLIDRLVFWGVDTIFGLPGDGVNGIFEALRQNQDKIRSLILRFGGLA